VLYTTGKVTNCNKINAPIRTSLSRWLPAARAKNSQRTICVLLREKSRAWFSWQGHGHCWT